MLNKDRKQCTVVNLDRAQRYAFVIQAVNKVSSMYGSPRSGPPRWHSAEQYAISGRA